MLNFNRLYIDSISMSEILKLSNSVVRLFKTFIRLRFEFLIVKL